MHRPSSKVAARSPSAPTRSLRIPRGNGPASGTGSSLCGGLAFEHGRAKRVHRKAQRVDPLSRSRSEARTRMSGPPSRVYVARLAGLPVYDPNGDQVGKVRDVVA